MQAKAICDTGLKPIIDQYNVIREETKQYIDDLDNQIKSLPGPSIKQKERILIETYINH